MICVFESCINQKNIFQEIRCIYQFIIVVKVCVQKIFIYIQREPNTHTYIYICIIYKEIHFHIHTNFQFDPYILYSSSSQGTQAAMPSLERRVASCDVSDVVGRFSACGSVGCTVSGCTQPSRVPNRRTLATRSLLGSQLSIVESNMPLLNYRHGYIFSPLNPSCGF